MSDYRQEDLQLNPFLSALQSQTSLAALYAVVAARGGVVLVPIASTLPRKLTLSFAQSHVLLPVHEAATTVSPHPRTIWHDVHGREVEVENGMIRVLPPVPAPKQPRVQATARVLFEELHYNDAFESFRVLCIDAPLVSGKQSSSSAALSSAASALPPRFNRFHTHVEKRSLSEHRDVIIDACGDDIATAAVFASPSLDLFYMDFTAELGQLELEEAGRCVWQAAQQAAAVVLQALTADPKRKDRVAAWNNGLRTQVEIAIHAHVIACVAAKILTVLDKRNEANEMQLADVMYQLDGVHLHLVDVGLDPALAAQCDPSPAVHQLSQLPTHITPLEKLHVLTQVEQALTQACMVPTKVGQRPSPPHVSSASMPTPLPPLVLAGSPPVLSALPASVTPSATASAVCPPSPDLSLVKTRRRSLAISHLPGTAPPQLSTLISSPTSAATDHSQQITPTAAASAIATTHSPTATTTPLSLPTTPLSPSPAPMSASSLSADDLLPLLVYVVVHSGPSHLYSVIDYCRYFAPLSALQPSCASELSYRLATLEAALTYLRNGRLNRLGGRVARARQQQQQSHEVKQTLKLLLTPMGNEHRSLFARPRPRPDSSGGEQSEPSVEPDSGLELSQSELERRESAASEPGFDAELDTTHEQESEAEWEGDGEERSSIQEPLQGEEKSKALDEMATHSHSARRHAWSKLYGSSPGHPSTRGSLLGVSTLVEEEEGGDSDAEPPRTSRESKPAHTRPASASIASHGHRHTRNGSAPFTSDSSGFPSLVLSSPDLQPHPSPPPPTPASQPPTPASSLNSLSVTCPAFSFHSHAHTRATSVVVEPALDDPLGVVRRVTVLRPSTSAATTTNFSPSPSPSPAPLSAPSSSTTALLTALTTTDTADPVPRFAAAVSASSIKLPTPPSSASASPIKATLSVTSVADSPLSLAVPADVSPALLPTASPSPSPSPSPSMPPSSLPDWVRSTSLLSSARPSALSRARARHESKRRQHGSNASADAAAPGPATHAALNPHSHPPGHTRAHTDSHANPLGSKLDHSGHNGVSSRPIPTAGTSHGSRVTVLLPDRDVSPLPSTPSFSPGLAPSLLARSLPSVSRRFVPAASATHATPPLMWLDVPPPSASASTASPNLSSTGVGSPLPHAPLPSHTSNPSSHSSPSPTAATAAHSSVSVTYLNAAHVRPSTPRGSASTPAS